MPLADVELPLDRGAMPSEAKRYLKEADVRIEAALAEARTPAFVPSDSAEAFPVLRAIAESSLARGNRFLEWGSGLGVTTGLAAMLDYEAYGIEIEPELVLEARRFADDFDLSCEFACGSFIPVGAEDRVYQAGDYSWLTTESDSAYAELGFDPDDFDLIFAYPWPDELDVTAQLFEEYAGVGSLLLTFQGGDGYRLRRKVERRGKSSKRRRA